MHIELKIEQTARQKKQLTHTHTALSQSVPLQGQRRVMLADGGMENLNF